jgi:hypothetical protein
VLEKLQREYKMAGVLNVSIKYNVTGIGDEVLMTNTQTRTVPVELARGYSVVSAQGSGQLLDTGDVALAKVYGVYIKAEVGTIYILLDTAAAEAVTTTNAHMVLLVGEDAFLPINAANNAGIVIDSVAATDAYSYVVTGKA